MSESLTPQQKTLRAQLAVYESWARTADRAARTEPARRSALERFEREVDAEFPDLPEATRAQMAEAKRKAYFKRLALASSRARAARAGGASG